MPWKGVTVTEQRQRFLEDYQLNFYSITELADRFCVSRKTAYKWINRFTRNGHNGFHELSRRPRSCPWQTDKAIVEELVNLRKAHPKWGPRKLLDIMHIRDPGRRLPAISTAALILKRNESVRPRRRYRRAQSWLSKERSCGTKRHLGCGLQGTISSEERETLFSTDGQRSLDPLSAGYRRPPCDLFGEDFCLFQGTF